MIFQQLFIFIGIYYLFGLSSGQCPDGYNNMASMCVYMGQQQPWAQAQKACESQNATLISPTAATPNFKDQWDQLSANAPANVLTTVWIGLHYDKASSKWTWSDGRTYDPTAEWAPWGTGQPNTAQGECVVVKIDLKQEKKPMWFMGSCTQGMKGICVKPGQTTIGTGTPFTMPSFPNVTCLPGLMAFAGNCMKYTQDPTTYQDALAGCVANNSYVLFTKDPVMWSYAEYALGFQLTNFWIGLSYDQASKQFKYSNGDVYDPTRDWAPWAKDNPGTPGAWAGDCVGVQQDYASGKYQWIMTDCGNGLQGVCLYNMPTTTTVTTTTTSTTSTPTTSSSSSSSSTSTSTSTQTSTTPTTASAALTSQSTSTPTASASSSTSTSTLVQTSATASSSAGGASAIASSSTAAKPTAANLPGSTPITLPTIPTLSSSSSASGQNSASSSVKTNTNSTVANVNTTTPVAANSTSSSSSKAATVSSGTSSQSISTVNSTVANGSTISTMSSMQTTSSTPTTKMANVSSIAVNTSANASTPSSLTQKGPNATSTTGVGTSNATSPTSATTNRWSCKRAGHFAPAPEKGRLAFIPFEVTNSTDSMECGKACMMRNACESIDYNNSTRECRLFSKSFADDCLQFIRDANFVHFDLLSIEIN